LKKLVIAQQYLNLKIYGNIKMCFNEDVFAEVAD